MKVENGIISGLISGNVSYPYVEEQASGYLRVYYGHQLNKNFDIHIYPTHIIRTNHLGIRSVIATISFEIMISRPYFTGSAYDF